LAEGGTIMKAIILATAATMMLVTAACSDNKGQASNQSGNPSSAPAADAAPARRPASAEQFARATDCAATFESVATLYRVMGETKSGAERDRLTQSSEQRGAAARQMATRAAAIGSELGMAPADVRAHLLQARQRLREESRVGDFGDFAVRMGREADRCVAAMPELL
jgi:hypothetical protein